MVRYLSNYSGMQYRIFVFSESEEYTKQALYEKKNVGQIIGGKFIFYPEGYEVPLTDREQDELKILTEGDVLDISGHGEMYRWYSVMEGDAGIMTTSRCNSNCLMCPASDGERRKDIGISIDNLKNIIRHYPDSLYYFTITGGEPTLIGEDNFVEVYRCVKKHLPYTNILILSNGRNFGSRSFVEKFIREGTDKLRIAIPIHGSNAEKHDYITQSPGGFIQTMRGITNILNAGVNLEIRIVVSKLNMNDVLDISRLICEKFGGVHIVHFVGLEMRGNCITNAEKTIISYEEAFRHCREGIKLLMSHGIDVALYNFPFCMIDKLYWPLAKQSISKYKAEYYDVCSACAMQDVCCGIFTATKNFYKPKVCPIKKEM